MLVVRTLARRFSAAAATPPADLSRYGAVLGGARMDEACARAFDTWALEFSADVADTGKRIDGVDLVSLDGHGKIKEFAVLARPPNGVAALKDEMMRRVPPRMLAFKARRALGF
ncbi:translation initiation factor IF-2 [Aureococcus anophagefferens]|nr:translation initiation factor IF-2 [Aureococcus anophagefferens]